MARLVDAAGGGLCPIHGEYIGSGKYGICACPFCDIEKHYQLRKAIAKAEGKKE